MDEQGAPSLIQHGICVVIAPDWREPEPGHWQSAWAPRLPVARHLVQDHGPHPRREAWVGALSRCVLDAGGPVVVAAHGLGCIATVHLPPHIAARIGGALLVAPVDPERRAALDAFAPVPCDRLPYRSIVVASSNDPGCPARRAGSFARAWGSEFLRLPDAGHIDAASGHGPWPLGLSLLQSLAASCSEGRAHHGSRPGGQNGGEASFKESP